MISLLYLGLLLTATAGNASLQKESLDRQRRSLVNLSDMVTDVTGKKSLMFVNYGNYCGFGGYGRAVDPIDECCKVHDDCYDVITLGSCKEKGEKGAYQAKYKWSKTKDGSAACDEGQEECETTVCLCDAMLANCLKANAEYYNSKNVRPMSFSEMFQEANYLSSRK